MATNPITSDSLTIDFKQLMKIPVGNRVQAASLSGSFLQSLINSLTPIQIAKAFPDYYRRSLPDISNFINASRYFDAGGKAHQTGGGELGYTPDYYDGETKPGGVPRGSELTLEQMKEELLKNGIDVEGTKNLIASGPILEGDERIQYLKKMSDADLLAAGFMRVQDENGKTLIQAAPSQYEGMSDEKILEQYKKDFPKASISPRERATLDLIAKREGAKDPNTIFGGNRYVEKLGLDKKPLTERTVSEVINEVMPKLRELSKADGYGVNREGRVVGTSAVGTGQMIEGTLKDNLRALGIPEKDWDKIKFDKDLQERLTLMNFKTSGIGDPNEDPSTWDHGKLGMQYESFDTSRGHAPLTGEEAMQVREKSPVRPENKEDITAQEALAKLQEAENIRRQEALIRKSYETGTASPTSSDYIQSPFEKQNVTVLHGQTDTFMARSSRGVLAAGIENIDPRLVTLGDAAIRSFEMMNPGYTVRVISGKRTEATNSGSPTSRHLRGGAVDYEIVDPDGNVLPNLGGGDSGVRSEAGFSAPKYEELGRYMEAARLNLAKDDPRYAEDQVVSGLHFGGNWWMDSMHMQLGGKGALGDLYSGFKSPEQLRQEGQPEVIVQAVENAIKAGANKSINEEEMQQLSEFLYNGGTAPIEVVQKVNPVVAEKLQKELEQKEIETAKKLEEEKATAAVQIQATPETSAQSVVPEVPVTNQSVEPNKPTAIPVKEQTASAAVPNNPVPQFALGGNMRGLNEDMTLVETETGKPIAQMGQNEKIEKQGNAIQVTPETKLKADELTEKYDASSEVETRMNDIEERIDQQQETSSQSARRPPAPEPIDNAPTNKWKEAVAAAERPVSPSFNRAIARAKFFPEGHHYQRGAVSSKST